MPAERPDPPDPSLGVFETMLVRDGAIEQLEAHLARLERSVRALYDLRTPEQLGAELRGVAASLAGRHRLRLDARPERGALATTIETSALSDGPPPGVIGRLRAVPGGLGAHKWRDRRLLDSLGSDTPLLLDSEGDTDSGAELLEAAWANVWIREDEWLLTPPADGRILPGVTRARLLSLASGLGLKAGEARLPLARALDASEVFLTSSLRLAVPAMIALDGAVVSAPEAGPVLTRIWHALDTPTPSRGVF